MYRWIAMFIYFVSAFVNEIKKSVRVKKSHATRRWRRISTWINDRKPKKTSMFKMNTSKVTPNSEEKSERGQSRVKREYSLLSQLSEQLQANLKTADMRRSQHMKRVSSRRETGQDRGRDSRTQHCGSW